MPVTEEKATENTPTRGPVPATTGRGPLSDRGWLRALYDRLVRGTPTPSAPLSSPARPAPSRIGSYTIRRKLGQGGMGTVYAAHDERLGRTVAIKMLSSLANDETARKRFWREARAAASVNHPNVCQIYEIGEENGELFIAMELLEGDPLAERMRRGALSVADAMPIGLGVLAALSALHNRGIVHRDLKPTNVFLTPHGVKLLDFGLARPSDPELALALGSATDLTHAGMVIGTPRYMAPEQVTGDAVDARSDLFALGAMLFEMLAGRPAFAGRSVVEILHATLYEQPPALTGSPAVTAADRVIRRALAKHPEERPHSAEAMAEELRAAGRANGDDTPALARPLTRLVVLPFRILRADPETDFLAFSLPDAIATSLSGFAALVVRSSVTAARFGGESPDLKALAAEADVDLVVTGTLLRAGDQLRVATQLVEAPAGTLLTSHTVQSSLGDLFRLQDDISHRVVEALALPLAGRGAWTARDAPRSARAYELYLRANELARRYDQLPLARDLYRRCLEDDPTFAPAWAHLARAYRVIGKYQEDPLGNYARAEEALRRALDLNPDLAVAHKFYAHLEAETGQATQALQRLLSQASRRGNDPELFAGLVHAARYCGLFDESVAAHLEARRLDPNVPTSLENTLLLIGAVDRLWEPTFEPDARILALGLAGRRDEARQELERAQSGVEPGAYTPWMAWLAAWIDGRRDDVIAGQKMLNLLHDDPEALFIGGWLFSDIGEIEGALRLLRRAVTEGFFVHATLVAHPAFDALRPDPRFGEIVSDADAGRRRAQDAFRAAGGERLLSVHHAASAV